MVGFGEQILAPLLDGIDASGAVLLVRDGRVAFANPAALECLGPAPRQRITGRSLADLLPSLDLADLPTERVLTVTRADGSHEQLRVQADSVTVRAVAYLRLRLAAQAPTVPAPPDILESLPDPVLRLDHAGRVIAVHAAPGGFPQPALIGRTLDSVLSATAATVLHAALNRITDRARIAREASAPLAPEQVEFEHVVDGRTRTFEARLAARAGRAEVACVLRDVSEDRRRERILRQREKMECVARMAGGIAHDFNNLLTAVVAHAEFARIEADADPSVCAHMQRILGVAEHAADLTRKLLAISQAHVPARDVVDAAAVVRAVAPEAASILGPHVALQVRAATDAPVRVDAKMLERVLRNVVLNARDALLGSAARAAAPARVTMAVRCVVVGPLTARRFPGLMPGRHVLIALRDNGCGMDDDTARRIFEPFFSSRRSRQPTRRSREQTPPGSGFFAAHEETAAWNTSQTAADGMGLALAYGVITHAGGHINVLSRPRRGTTVLMYLPWAEPAVTRRAAPAGMRPRGRGQILLVDDETSVREVIGRTLALHGFSIVEAGDGLDALERVAGLAPDAIDLLITDIVMPRVGGRELATRLRARWPHLKVLYISGCTQSALDARDLSLPGTAFLQKPFLPLELARAAQALVESSREGARGA